MSWRVRVRLSGMDRNQAFADDCETLVVNLHGCALQSPRALRPGTPIQLEVSRRTLKGRIMDSVPLDSDQSRWMLGIALEQPGNHWGIQYPPEDWGTAPSPAAPAQTASDTPPQQAPAAPGPLAGDATATANNAKAPQAATSGLREEPRKPVVTTQVPVERPSTPPVPAMAEAPPAAPPPVAPLPDAVLKEIRAQLVQLQQAQAKQDAMLLQERAERQAARTTAEQTVADQLERVRQAKDYVESLVCSVPSIIEAQAQEQAQSVMRRLQPQTSRAELETLVRDAQQVTEATLEQRATQLMDDLRRQLEELVDQRRQAADAAYAAAAKQLQELEERANQVTALVDVELQKHAEEIVVETVAEIRKELEQTARPRESQITEPHIEADHDLEALVRQAGDAAAELRQTLKSVQQEHRMNEAATARLQHQSEAVQAWLERETEKFQESLRAAFVDAGGEIRGRIAQAVETAAAPIEACSLEIQERMTAMAEQHVQGLHRHADVACERLESCSEQARAAIAADMQARLSEALASFTVEAQQLAQTSIARWQTAVTQTLAAIPKLLAERLAAER